MVELLLVIGIIGIAAVFAVTVSSQSLSRNYLRSTTQGVFDALRRAEFESLAGRQDSSWGVHLAAGQYVFFRGSSYNVSDPDNEPVTLPGNIVLQSISLNGGGADVIFAKVTGDTTTYGSLQVKDNNNNETTTITINSEGAVDVN